MLIKQLILVKAEGNRCRIYCMERRRGGGYVRVMPAAEGYVGKTGITKHKKEGDMKTPAGTYAIGFAFGRGKHINTRLDYRQITFKSRWCTNPDSKVYNRWTDKRWEKDCEDLWKYHSEYKYGAVIKYNMDESAKKGRGSAIFIHCKNSPTAGCVAARQECIKKILAWLDSRKNPHIYITKQGASSCF